MPAVQLRTVATTPPPRSVEREALARSIEKHNDAVRQLAATESAQTTTQEVVYAARRAVKQSPALIEEATINAARHLTDMAMGTPGSAPMSVKDARAKAQDAEDELAAAEAALAALVQQAKQVEQHRMLTHMNLNERVRDVVRVEANVEQLLANFEVTQRMLIEQRLVLEFLASHDAIPAAHRFFASDRTWPDLADVAKPWRDAVTALESNADAPLSSS